MGLNGDHYSEASHGLSESMIQSKRAGESMLMSLCQCKAECHQHNDGRTHNSTAAKQNDCALCEGSMKFGMKVAQRYTEIDFAGNHFFRIGLASGSGLYIALYNFNRKSLFYCYINILEHFF